MPLPILGLHHIAVSTEQVEASIRFYCDVLGFRPIRRPNFDFRGAWLLGYGVQIHIIEHRKDDGERNTRIDTRDNHLAFAVADHAPVKAALDALGTPYIERVNAGGIPQIFLHDPDGHTIEIGIYPPHPPYIDE
jgi:catechol 2,3-dioxygenase-like lactoylglutathione lyase family enzyme